jgi:hypothetical protein
MAGFDTSNVAATVGQNVPPYNPLAMVGQFAQTQNALNQNRLFQAQQLGGQAYAAALNPDGTIDQNKLAAALRDPRAAIVAPQMAQEAQTYATGAQDLASKRIARLQAAISAIPPGPDQVKQAALTLQRGVQNNLWTQDDAAAYTGAGLPGLIKQAAIENGSPAAQTAQFGDITEEDTGPNKLFLNVNRYAPNGGAVAPVAAIDKGLTPTEKASPVVTYDANGVPTRHTLGEYVTDTGAPKPGTAPVVGISPQTQATLSTRGANEAQFEAQLQSRAADVPQRKANLDLLSGLADEFQPGPQSNFWLHLQGLAREYGLPMPDAANANNRVAAQQEFNKIATQVLAAQRQATGLSSTDQQTQLAGMAAPNAQLSREGIQRVVGTLKANEDLYNAQFQLWERAKTDPRFANMTFDQYQAKFNRTFNPLVFQAMYAGPEERAKIIKQVGPKAFEAQAKALYNDGLINGQ